MFKCYTSYSDTNACLDHTHQSRSRVLAWCVGGHGFNSRLGHTKCTRHLKVRSRKNTHNTHVHTHKCLLEQMCFNIWYVHTFGSQRQVSQLYFVSLKLIIALLPSSEKCACELYTFFSVSVAFVWILSVSLFSTCRLYRDR